jgi:hypothetical protein
VEEVQRVALEHLAVVHQPPDLLGRRRQLLAADDAVHGLGGGQVVADRADAAQPLHDDRHLPVGPAEDEPLEAAELDDVQPRLRPPRALVHVDGDLAVPLDAGQRLDRVLPGRALACEPWGSAPSVVLQACVGDRPPAGRSSATSASQMVSAGGGQPGRK